MYSWVCNVLHLPFFLLQFSWHWQNVLRYNLSLLGVSQPQQQLQHPVQRPELMWCCHFSQGNEISNRLAKFWLGATHAFSPTSCQQTRTLWSNYRMLCRPKDDNLRSERTQCSRHHPRRHASASHEQNPFRSRSRSRNKQNTFISEKETHYPWSDPN